MSEKSSKLRENTDDADARLSEHLEQMRLSEEIMETMEDEGIRMHDLEVGMEAAPGFAERALAGELPVETLKLR
jgi:hypothetical protein